MAFSSRFCAQRIRCRAPRLGEHSREVCRDWLELPAAEVDALIAAGVLEAPGGAA